jgi:hypothetical protein
MFSNDDWRLSNGVYLDKIQLIKAMRDFSFLLAKLGIKCLNRKGKNYFNGTYQPDLGLGLKETKDIVEAYMSYVVEKDKESIGLE